MLNIENLLIHKFPFEVTHTDIDRDEPFINSKVLYFTTKFLKIPYFNLLAELKPFISFLQSSAVKNINLIYESIYTIFLQGETDEPENLPIITFKLKGEPCVNFEKYRFYKENFKKCLNSSLNYLICVKATYYFDPTIGQEDIETMPLIKSFKQDKCVVCLENEPNILFNECNHICICFECEKITQFKKCPCCRSIVYKRIKI